MKPGLNYHVIKDPVHGVMQFTTEEDNWIKPFIDHPCFQRLRHIKQIGMADLVFPGAVHTRFNHGLGCCYVASQIANKIGLEPEARQLVIIAALMHDIGHGPFSHAFEDIFPNKAIKHEMWTPYFLNEFRTSEFLERYNKLNPDFKLNDERLDYIQQIIMHRYPNKLLTDIVSSQLDADRFDYLLRDSHFCGAQYGKFDLRWMLHCLTIIDTKQGLRLGISYKGIGVVEHYLMARRLMMKNIYHHQKKFAIENLLVKLFSSLADNISHEPFLKEIQKTPLGEFLINAANLKEQHAEITAQVASQFLQDNFMLYKGLFDYHVNLLISQLATLDEAHDVVALAKRIHFRRLPEIYPLSVVDLDAANEIVDAFKEKYKDEVRPWQLEVINTPQLAYTMEDDQIYVQEKSGSVVPISDKSLMLGSLSDKYEHVCALFIDHSIIEHAGLKLLLDLVV